MESTVVQRLLETGDSLLKLAESHADENIRVVLLAAAAEAYASAILLTSSKRRSKRVCSTSTKRLLSMALLDARRLLLLDQEELNRLRRVLQSLRCMRNDILHPVRCGREKCRKVDLAEAMEAVEKLRALAMNIVSKRSETKS